MNTSNGLSPEYVYLVRNEANLYFVIVSHCNINIHNHLSLLYKLYTPQVFIFNNRPLECDPSIALMTAIYLIVFSYLYRLNNLVILLLINMLC